MCYSSCLTSPSRFIMDAKIIYLHQLFWYLLNKNQALLGLQVMTHLIICLVIYTCITKNVFCCNTYLFYEIKVCPALKLCNQKLYFGLDLPIPTQWHLLTPLGNKPFENTVGKGEIVRNEQFLLFPQCFLPVWITFCHFHQIWNCHLQTLSVWKSLKFVIW